MHQAAWISNRVSTPAPNYRKHHLVEAILTDQLVFISASMASWGWLRAPPSPSHHLMDDQRSVRTVRVSRCVMYALRIHLSRGVHHVEGTAQVLE
jgi:hypothetical protein